MGRELCCLICKHRHERVFLPGWMDAVALIFGGHALLFGAVLLLQTCATVHMMSVHGLDSPHFLLCSDETRVGVVENLGVG